MSKDKKNIDKISNSLFPFGKYEGISVKRILLDEPNYILYAISQPGLKRKYPDFISGLEQIVHLLPEKNYGRQIQFGRYQGRHLNEVALNKRYSKWLLTGSNSTFEREYPRQHKYLSTIFEKLYGDIDDDYQFYVLYAPNGRYIKVGQTRQSIVRRLHAYYHPRKPESPNNFDLKRSIIIKTDYENLESEIKNIFKKFRIGRSTEYFPIEKHSDVLNEVLEIKKRNPDKYFIFKSIFDFVPYEDAFTFQKVIKFHHDKPHNFEDRYLKQLKNDDKLKYYDPFYSEDNSLTQDFLSQFWENFI
jgi:uncharacterized protein (DUF3820 family)